MSSVRGDDRPRALLATSTLVTPTVTLDVPAIPFSRTVLTAILQEAAFVTPALPATTCGTGASKRRRLRSNEVLRRPTA